MKLIDTKTGKEVKAGDTVINFRGECGILFSTFPPREIGKSGKVEVVDQYGYHHNWYPSVIGCKFEDL